MRLEAASRNRIKMKRLLINLYLLLEADLGDGNERRTRIADPLYFNSNDCVMSDCVGKVLFARGTIPRRSRPGKILASIRNKTDPDVYLAVFNPVRHLRVVAIAKVIVLIQPIHLAAEHQVNHQLPKAISPRSN